MIATSERTQIATQKQGRGSAPRISRAMLSLFALYTRRYFASHFSALYLSGQAPHFDRAQGPYVIFLNHASWWDPLVSLLLANRFTWHFSNFAPIDL